MKATRHRLVLLYCCCALALACGTPASAAEQEAAEDGNAGERSQVRPALSGRLTFEGDPVSGALVTASDEQGNPVADTRSGAEGRWQLELPGAGRYLVELDQQTLPEGIAVSDPERSSLSLTVRPGQQRTLLFPLGEQDGPGARFLPGLAQVTVNGLKFGFIIAITALGLSIVFGTTRLINFAHGDMVTLGAVTAFFFNSPASGPRLHIFVACLLAMAVGAGFGASLEKFLWEPLRRRRTGVIQLLVITIGLALLLRHLILLQFGGRPRRYLEYAVQEPFNFGWIRITPRDLGVIAISGGVLLLIGLMLLYTRFGKAMRAVSDNRDLAESSGVDVKKVILATWALGGTLAALGGVLLGVVETVDYLMGFRLLLLMFAAVILGGLGTAFGAMAGGVVIGLVTEISTLFSPTELKFMWGLGALVLVLLFRPQGIFGRWERVG